MNPWRATEFWLITHELEQSLGDLVVYRGVPMLPNSAIIAEVRSFLAVHCPGCGTLIVPGRDRRPRLCRRCQRRRPWERN